MPFHCFAYGSNMFTVKMRQAAPSAEFRAIARLPRHRLRFNKMSTDGSGKGNIVPTDEAGGEVWGVVFEVEDGDRTSLNNSEGGYAPVMIEVLTSEGTRSVLTYIAKPNRVDDARRPYTWYKEFLVRGAQEHHLPQTYQEQLQAIVAAEDPNKRREQRSRALVNQR